MPDKLVPDAADPVATLVFFLIIFTVVAVVFLFFHLLMGSVIRPNKPDAEKLTIYECGEPTVGSAWIQFDLRFYVVALLFVIFDVEVAFFFPWAVVFGKANQLASMPPVETRPAEKLTDAEKATNVVIEAKRMNLSEQLFPTGLSVRQKVELKLAELERDPVKSKEANKPVYKVDEEETRKAKARGSGEVVYKTNVIPIKPSEASSWAQFAFWELLTFFAVLLVGFAYVWRRGDIDWVRAYAHHKEPAAEPEKVAEQEKVMV